MGNQADETHRIPGQLSHNCMLIRDAALWNREGATLLLNGDLDSAIDRLRNALETIEHAGGLLPSAEVKSTFASRSFPFDTEPRLRSKSISQMPSLSTRNDDCEDGSFFVYSSPFVFYPIAEDTPEYATNCAAVILFNLALAMHQRGRLADSRALYRARSLYSMSLTLVGTMSFQAACANLNVAATNNMAHVHFEVADVGEGKDTLHNLMNILGAGSGPPPFGDAEIEKFYMNILHLNSSTMAGAA